MTDREKIIKGLECCSEASGYGCNHCPYGDECRNTTLTGCAHLCQDALELLNEQPKPKSAHWAKMTGMMSPEFTGHFECDNCGWYGKPFVREIDFAYCPGCGAKMSIDGLYANDCKKTPFDQILKDYLEATGGVVKI